MKLAFNTILFLLAAFLFFNLASLEATRLVAPQASSTNIAASYQVGSFALR